MSIKTVSYTHLKGNFEEATLVMEKLDSNHYQFSQMEKLFYMYLVTLYYYSTNQIIMAYRQVKVLINERIDEEVLYLSLIHILF